MSIPRCTTVVLAASCDPKKAAAAISKSTKADSSHVNIFCDLDLNFNQQAVMNECKAWRQLELIVRSSAVIS